MKCAKCKGIDFQLETSIVIKEIYRLYKNGQLSKNPIKAEVTNEDMTDNENIIRCRNCSQGYVLEKPRRELLEETNFNKVDLNKEGHLTIY